MLRTIIAFIVVFSVIVIFHEFGHYYFAKRAGILVREFAIGMGPKIFQVRRGETVYTLRLLPVGGYVRMAGAEEDDEEIKPGMMVMIQQDDDGVVERLSFDEGTPLESGVPFQIESADLTHEMTLTGYIAQQEEKVTLTVSKTATVIESDGTELVVAPVERQFQSASLGHRMMTNFAGPMNNFILAIVTFMLVAFLSGGVASTEPVVGGFTDNSAAQAAGLQVGDRITAIDGVVIHNWRDISSQIVTRANVATTMVISRNGNDETVTVTPAATTGANGSQVGVLGIVTATKTDFLSKLLYGFTQTWYVIVTVFTTIASFFTRGFSLNDLGGPVAIYSMTSQVAQNGLIPLLTFLGLISANLGAMNLLPIPALDGGKLVLNIIEGIRKKPLSPEKESYITIAGAIFLIALMILVTWNDIMRLF